MYETLPALPQHSAIIEALSEGDTSAWCFFPGSRSESIFCSQPFRSLWNLPPIQPGTGGELSWSLLAEAFEASNIPAEEFFECVTGRSTDLPGKFRLVYRDDMKIQTSLQSVFSNTNGAIVGKLLYLRVLSDTNLTAGLLDQISEARKRLEILSRREMEILNMVYEGRTNKAISMIIGISQKTVEKHRSRILLKLGLTCSTLMIRIITVARMLPDFPEML